MRRGDSGEVTAAVVNAPLTTGDAILTAAKARAEVQFDASNVARIAANSDVRMGDLTYQRHQIQIAIGLVTFTVLRNSGSQSEIDTPNVAVHSKGQGAYRILVREDGTSEITVRAGEADVASAKGSEVLRAGQTMLVRGPQDDPEFQINNAIAEDDWDRWNVERDHHLMESGSSRYVSPDVYGAEDLDNSGRWTNDGAYGTVWAPNVAPDWAPYTMGRWVWVDYYGWTWVSSDPWGWAPYHYGRWYRASFGWAWWPGPIHARYYWSPAVVGFFGFGGYSGFSAGLGFGFANVGWVPLAPFEPFHRWWGAGFRGSVIVNNFNVYNSYRNARVAGGVTAVGAANFGRGGARFMSVNGATIRNAGGVRGTLPLTPSRASLRFSDRPVNMSSFRQTSRTAFFGSRTGISGGRAGSFEQQRQAVDRAARTTFAGPEAGRGSTGGFPRAGAGAGSNVGGAALGGAAASHGWNRFGEPIHSGTSTSAQASGGAGWSRYNGGSTAAGGRSYSSPYGGGGNAVHINPSFVRPRPAQQPSSAGRGYGEYGGARSAPSYAPRSAPSGGASRGGGRSSSGGGRHR